MNTQLQEPTDNDEPSIEHYIEISGMTDELMATEVDNTDDSDSPYRVYLCGPVQNVDYDDARTWHTVVQNMHSDGDIEWVDPLDQYDDDTEVIHETFTDTRGIDSDEYVTAATIVEHCYETINQCDAMLVRYQDVASVGTAMEIKEAHDAGMPIVVWFDESISTTSLPEFLSVHVDHIFTTVQSSIDTIVALSEAHS